MYEDEYVRALETTVYTKRVEGDISAALNATFLNSGYNELTASCISNVEKFMEAQVVKKIQDQHLMRVHDRTLGVRALQKLLFTRKKEIDYQNPDKKITVENPTSPLVTVREQFFFGALVSEVEDVPFIAHCDKHAPVDCDELDELFCHPASSKFEYIADEHKEAIFRPSMEFSEWYRSSFKTNSENSMASWRAIK